MGPMMLNMIQTIDILMEFNASLDIPEADGITPRRHFLGCGPRVTAAVTKWIRKRNSEEAPREKKSCDSCGKESASLKNCAKCRVARYCSVDCQRSAWPTHKRTCNPFSHSNTVVLIPHYHAYNNTIPTADLTRRAMGYPSEAEAWSKNKMRGAHAPKKVDKESKSITIKVQVPWNFQGDLEASKKSSGDLLVYTKKRDFACTIRKRDAPAEYDRIAAVVREKGVGGAKAYFAAELESRDRLVVKVTEVLAEQPW
ncbi:unnamed protein product [Mycena citricolor]|uniref:MYND-type domain-containing protein n=1 Tax=Mycena citricolor TaxID=2018698 RepID=A0AAD2GUP1_9AGAR|nr:unnamed protein product [Mycena citricolor]